MIFSAIIWYYFVLVVLAYYHEIKTPVTVVTPIVPDFVYMKTETVQVRANGVVVDMAQAAALRF